MENRDSEITPRIIRYASLTPTHGKDRELIQIPAQSGEAADNTQRYNKNDEGHNEGLFDSEFLPYPNHGDNLEPIG